MTGKPRKNKNSNVQMLGSQVSQSLGMLAGSNHQMEMINEQMVGQNEIQNDEDNYNNPPQQSIHDQNQNEFAPDQAQYQQFAPQAEDLDPEQAVQMEE